MSLLYYGEFDAFNGDTWRAELRDSNSATTTGTELVLAGDGITFKHDGDGDEFYKNPIRSASCSVFFNVTSTTDETFFQNLCIENEGDKAIVIYKNSSLYWVGRILPDINQYQRKPLVNTVFEVVGVDTLSLLDQYTIDRDWFTNDRINGITLVKNILSVTGLEDFWTQVGATNFIADALFTYNQTSGSAYHLADYQFNYLSFYEDISSLLNQKFPDFEGAINCKQALENILQVFNARIYLIDGLFQIFQPQSFNAGTTIIYDIYNTSGTLVTNNANYTHGVNISTNQLRPKWSDFPTVTAQPAIKQLKTKLKNSLAYKFNFRDRFSVSSAQLSVDEFNLSLNTSTFRVLADLIIDLRNYQGTTIYNQYRYLDVNLKYRVFAWNGTAALFWDWQNNTFNDPTPPDNGWKYKKIAIPDDKGFNRQQYQAEFDAEYAPRVGASGGSTGYTIYAEFEIVWRQFSWISGLYNDYAMPFYGFVRVMQGAEDRVQFSANQSVSPNASKEEEIYLNYWDNGLNESPYLIKVNDGTNFVNPGNWVSFNSFVGKLEKAWANNVMSIYKKAVLVIQGNWIDAGNYSIKKSLVFDSKKWIWNGGTHRPKFNTFDGEWLCIDDDASDITIGTEDEMQEGSSNAQDKDTLKGGRILRNDTSENITQYEKSLPYFILPNSVDLVSAEPTLDTEWGVKINYNEGTEALSWNIQELGKVTTITTATYNAGGYTELYLCDTTAHGITVTLPSAADYKGRRYIFKKTKASHSLAIQATSIDDGSEISMNNKNEAITVMSDGSQWWVIAKFP